MIARRSINRISTPVRRAKLLNEYRLKEGAIQSDESISAFTIRATSGALIFYLFAQLARATKTSDLVNFTNSDDGLPPADLASFTGTRTR